MEELIIQPTGKSMKIELRKGDLHFSGCSITNDPKAFFSPVMKWVEDYSRDPAPETVVHIKFEYIDSASVKSFYEILKELKNSTRNQKLLVNWHYDYEDPEILELGEIIQSKLNTDFRFIEYTEE
jgi:hypothetical protein